MSPGRWNLNDWDIMMGKILLASNKYATSSMVTCWASPLFQAME
ncbi:MAG: hypothetical protein EAZ62_04665 [Sphingobacteriia bacterium]|nr:MAG: hypothetical protein EAZ62_04665 [Sphingobacteriia bacterium]